MSSGAGRSQSSYAKAAVLVTMFHHVTTAIGAYGHYARDSHYTIAMWIGVWVNVGLTVLGAAVLLAGVGNGQTGRARKSA